MSDGLVSSLEKNSLEKNSLEKNSLEKNSLEKNNSEKGSNIDCDNVYQGSSVVSNSSVFSSVISVLNVTYNDSFRLHNKKDIFSDTDKEQLIYVYNYHVLYLIHKQEIISKLLDITTDATELSLCYDLLSVNQRDKIIPYEIFWNCMKLLDYNFAYISNATTIFHRLLYQFCCTLHKPHMTIHEALLLIMVLKNKCSAVPFIEFINDFIHFMRSTGHIDINTWTTLPKGILTVIKDKELLYKLSRTDYSIFWDKKENQLFGTLFEF